MNKKSVLLCLVAYGLWLLILSLGAAAAEQQQRRPPLESESGPSNVPVRERVHSRNAPRINSIALGSASFEAQQSSRAQNATAIAWLNYHTIEYLTPKFEIQMPTCTSAANEIIKQNVKEKMIKFIRRTKAAASEE